MTKLILFLVSCFISFNLFAEEMSSSELMSYCENRRSAICDSYIIGFTAGVVAGSLFDIPPRRCLIPLTLKNMFMKEMREHPEAGDFGASGTLAYLLLRSGKVTEKKHT